MTPRTPRPRRDTPRGGKPLSIPLTAAEREQIGAAAGEIPAATWARAILLRAARERPR